MEKMVKRLLSVAIALAMVLSWLPATALQAEAVESGDLCACGCGETASQVTWQELTAGALDQAGHYYLSADLALTETLQVSAAVTLDLRGKDITPAEGVRTIYVNSGASLTILDTVGDGEIYGADITAGGEYGGTIYVKNNAALNVLSGVVRDGKATRGGNILSQGTTTISGKARVINGNADRGGNIYVTSGSTTVTGYAKVLDGVATTTGGNIMVQNTATILTLAGRTTVAGGQAKNGINLASMYGNVVITDNAVVDAGATEGATSMNIAGSGEQSSTLDISGGTLYGKIDVGALVSSIKISGAPVIKHLSLATGKRIDPTGMTEGASVTVEAVDTAITDTLTDAESYAPYFQAYASGSTVIAKDSALQITGGCPCCGEAYSAITWTSWSGGAITESGHYRLSASATITTTATVASGVTAVIDLNGMTLTASGARAITVSGELSIVDLVGGGTIKGADVSGLDDTSSTAYLARGGAIRVDDGAVLKLSAATLTGGKATRPGNIQSYGTINIYDGASITEGTATSRGGNINNEGKIYIFGGTVSSTTGNSIYSTNYHNTVHIYGGTVSGGSSANTIFLFGSSLYISGGTVSGGAVRLAEYANNQYHSRLVVTGGTIKSAVIVESATYKPEIVITGGTFSGAVTVNSAESFFLAGAPSITSLTMGTDAELTLGELTEGANLAFAEDYGWSDNISWMYDDGGLYLAGTGAMPDYTSTSLAPWSGYASSITKLVIGEGITTIGNYAFCDFSLLTSVVVPDTVYSIGNWAFRSNSKLATVTLPASLNTIKSYAFRYDSNISSVIYNGTQSQWDAIAISSGNTELTDASGFQCQTTVSSSVTLKNTTWAVSGNTLTISGTGAMNDYYHDTSWTKYTGTPWSDYADQITTVVIQSGVTSVGNWAFYGLKNLASVTIPSTVTTIGESAFRGCTALQTVSFANVTKIGGYAFSGCTALTGVTAGSALTQICAGAFSGCASLTTLTGASAVDTLGDKAFDGCTSLTAFGDWFSSDYAVVDGVLYSSDKTTLLQFPGGYTGSFTVPAGVTTIADYAFSNCKNLTEIVVSDSVTTIGAAAFDGCTAVQTISIGAGVSDLGIYAFSNCDSLQAFVVSANNGSFSSDASGSLLSRTKTALRCAPGGVEDYTVPASVTTINYYAFYANNTVKTVTLPDKTATIGGLAFAATENLKEINIPAGMQTIYKTAFEASRVTDVNYPGTLAEYNAISIGANNEPLLAAKVHCTLMDTTSCGDGVTAILDTDGLLTITGTGSITTAPWSAYAESITTVVIEEGVTAIGENAFNGCTGLTDATIPATVTEIGANAFNGCTGLTTINYGCTEILWNKMTVGEGNEALENAEKIFADAIAVGITIATLPTKTDYAVGDTIDPTGMEVNIVYNDETTAPANLADCVVTGALTIPGKQTVTVTYGDFSTTFQVNVSASGVSGAVNWTLDADGKLTISGTGAMGDNASVEAAPWYDYMACITSLEICEGVTGTLSKHAFRNAPNLASVSIPEGITRIGSSAFLNCVSLTEVVLPNSVVDIRASAFSGCTGLKTVSIGTAMKLIQASSFNKCSALTTVNYADSKTQWDAITVEETGNDALLNATMVYGKKLLVGVDVTLSQDVKVEYYMNEEINLTGLVVTVTYDDGSTEVTTDYTVEYDFTTAGTKTVTIKYAEQTVDTYEVTVLPAGVSEDGLSWRIDAEGLLTILAVVEEGEEDAVMMDYTEEAPAPWAAYAESITAVVIDGNIANVGAYAFANCVNLAAVSMPKSITAIGDNAFLGCAALAEVTYSGLASDWAAITVGEGNEALTQANITCQILYGDANGDGAVNCQDTLLIMKYLAGWDVEIDLAAADVTGDGRVNTQDSLLIMKYLADWDVVLGPQA